MYAADSSADKLSACTHPQETKTSRGLQGPASGRRLASHSCLRMQSMASPWSGGCEPTQQVWKLARSCGARLQAWRRALSCRWTESSMSSSEDCTESRACLQAMAPPSPLLLLPQLPPPLVHPRLRLLSPPLSSRPQESAGCAAHAEQPHARSQAAGYGAAKHSTWPCPGRASDQHPCLPSRSKIRAELTQCIARESQASPRPPRGDDLGKRRSTSSRTVALSAS